MKRLSIFILICGMAQGLFAQQLPLYTQYYNNEFLYNPSQTMTEDNGSLSLIYRKQWADIQGAPVTKGLLFQTPIVDEKVGLGLQLISDQWGIFNRTGGFMSYSYQLDLNHEHKILLGLSAGFMQTRYDWGLITNQVIDPSLINNPTDKTNVFDANFGFTYKWDELEFGVSVPHLFDKDLGEFAGADSNMLYHNTRHYLASLSYRFSFSNDEMSVRPIVLARYHPVMGFAPEGSVVFDYKQQAWLAAGYRLDGAVTLGAGAVLHERINVGYSYDITTSEMGAYTGATHEVSFGFRLGLPSRPKIKEDDETKKRDTLPSVTDLLKRIKKLEKRMNEQSDTLSDHEERIKGLEDVRDSLQKQMEQMLQKMKVGTGSWNYDDPDVPLLSGKNPIVNPEDPEAPFGYKEDGTPLGSNEAYDGKLYKDEAKTVEITNPRHSNELYTETGEKIRDIENYSGPVYNVKGDLVGVVDNMKSPDKNIGPIYKPEDLMKDGIRYTAPGNYVVVGSFRQKENAISLRESLQDEGHDAGIVYNHLRRWFYVYIIETEDFDAAVRTLREQKLGGRPDSWIHVIVE